MWGMLFNQVAELDSVAYTQDVAGGELPNPSAAALLVPCAVQQDGAPEPTEDQERRGSVAKVRIFFRPDRPPGVLALRALGQGDRVKVVGFPNPLILDGPPWDAAGRGVVFEAAARDYR